MMHNNKKKCIIITILNVNYKQYDILGVIIYIYIYIWIIYIYIYIILYIYIIYIYIYIRISIYPICDEYIYI